MEIFTTVICLSDTGLDRNVNNLNVRAENTETERYQTFSPSTFEAHSSPNGFSVNTKPCGLVKKIPARV